MNTSSKNKYNGTYRVVHFIFKIQSYITLKSRVLTILKAVLFIAGCIFLDLINRPEITAISVAKALIQAGFFFNGISCPDFNMMLLQGVPEMFNDPNLKAPRRKWLFTLILIMGVLVTAFGMYRKIDRVQVYDVVTMIDIIWYGVMNAFTQLGIISHLTVLGSMVSTAITTLMDMEEWISAHSTYPAAVKELQINYLNIKCAMETPLFIFFSTMTILGVFQIFLLIIHVVSGEDLMLIMLGSVKSCQMILIPVYLALCCEDIYDLVKDAINHFW